MNIARLCGALIRRRVERVTEPVIVIGNGFSELLQRFPSIADEEAARKVNRGVIGAAALQAMVGVCNRLRRFYLYENLVLERRRILCDVRGLKLVWTAMLDAGWEYRDTWIAACSMCDKMEEAIGVISGFNVLEKLLKGTEVGGERCRAKELIERSKSLMRDRAVLKPIEALVVFAMEQGFDSVLEG